MAHELRRRAREDLKDGPDLRIYNLFNEQNNTYRFAAPPYAIDEVRTIFRDECPGTKSVLDMTAHVGHDIAFFLLTWPGLRITACELDDGNADLLSTNLKRALDEGAIPSKSSIHIEVGDSVAYLASKEGRKEKVDFVYIDAPWEADGKNYKRNNNVHLKLGDLYLDEVVKRVFKQDVSNTVVLKVPINYAFSDIIERVMQWREYRCKCTVRSVAYKGRDRSRTVSFFLVFITRV